MSDSKEADVRGSVNIYKMMLKNKQFIFGVFILGLSYSIVILFNTTGPFIIENTFNFTPVTIGYCTLLLGFLWVLGGMIAKINMGLAFRFRVFVPLLIQLVAAGVLLGISFFIKT